MIASQRIVTPLVLSLLFLPVERADAHCQVPCGIYDDHGRFEAMLEDTETITKAIAQMGELAGSHSALGNNQLVRWVTTKESHATNIQRTIADYFMAQRIKGDDPKYVEKLTASHAVIVAAMKAKQTADPAAAEALKASVLAFHQAYAGKPFAESHHHH